MLKGVVSLVTGGAGGLGRATVERLVSCGGRVVVLDVQGTRARDLAAASPQGTILAMTGNITSEEDVRRCLDSCLERFGRLDVLVNCAGVSETHQTYNFTKNIPHRLDDFAKILNVNAVGTFNAIRLAAGVMGQNEPGEDGRRGVIVNTASVVAYEGDIGQAAIAASSAAIVGLTLPVARDLAARGIRVVTIAPGLFDTPLTSYLPDRIKHFLSRMSGHPARFGRPSEFAHLVTAAIENPMLNGEVIRLDAALRLYPL